MCEVRGSGSSYWSWASKICPHHLSRAAFPQHWVSLTAMTFTDCNAALKTVWGWDECTIEDETHEKKDETHENDAIRQFGHTLVEVFSNVLKGISDR
jgi:hypothetical protein